MQLIEESLCLNSSEIEKKTRKIMKMNYLNYLKTEHIIDMMLTLHSDHQEQMRSIIDMMLMSEQETIITIL